MQIKNQRIIDSIYLFPDDQTSYARIVKGTRVMQDSAIAGMREDVILFYRLRVGCAWTSVRIYPDGTPHCQIWADIADDLTMHMDDTDGIAETEYIVKTMDDKFVNQHFEDLRKMWCLRELANKRHGQLELF